MAIPTRLPPNYEPEETDYEERVNLTRKDYDSLIRANERLGNMVVNQRDKLLRVKIALLNNQPEISTRVYKMLVNILLD